MAPVARRKRIRPQNLAARCYQRDIVVPSTLEGFKQELKKWMAVCVTSRTLDRTGKPIKREESLVDQSSSIGELWDDVKTFAGHSVNIGAEYVFRTSQHPEVAAVKFFWRTPEWDFEGDIIEANPSREATIDRVAQRFVTAVKKHLSGERKSRILCCLKQVMDSSALRDKWELKYVSHDQLKDETRPITEDHPLHLGHMTSFVRDYGDFLYGWRGGIDAASDETLAREIAFQVDEQLNQGLAVIIGWGGAETKALLTRGHFFIREWVLEQSKDANSVYHCFR